MNTHLDFCLAIQRAYASLQLKLNDELGTYHGISFSDFVLLNLLAETADGRVRMTELVQALGQPLSAVVRQLITLEKIGLITRDGASSERYAVLRPAGRTLTKAARETASNLCSEAVASIPLATVEVVADTLIRLAHEPALALL